MFLFSHGGFCVAEEFHSSGRLHAPMLHPNYCATPGAPGCSTPLWCAAYFTSPFHHISHHCIMVYQKNNKFVVKTTKTGMVKGGWLKNVTNELWTMLVSWCSASPPPFQIAPIQHFAITPLVMAYIFYHFTIASCATLLVNRPQPHRDYAVYNTITPLHHYTIIQLTTTSFNHFTITPVRASKHHTEVWLFQESVTGSEPPVSA